MKLLTEIKLKENLHFEGRVLIRNAVRGIILNRDELFMVFSKKNGDYKFPGGGIAKGEDEKKALIREIKEETGATVEKIVGEFGKVIEYNMPKEEEYALFKMISKYFLCEIGKVFVDPKLEQYEAELGFTARWVTLEKALASNQRLLQGPSSLAPRWVRREVFILEQIKGTLLKKRGGI